MGSLDKEEPAHYGTKPGHFETSKIHFPRSEGVSEVSKRASERSGVSEGVNTVERASKASEQCEGMREQTRE